MRNPNYLSRNQNTTVTTWDSLKDVPFMGEKKSRYTTKELLKDRLINLRRVAKRGPMTVERFMLSLISDIQPILAHNNMELSCDDYGYWRDVLGELKPILAAFWAECDPMIINYMFLVFVAQFIVILKLWEQLDFSSACVSDCAILGEYFMREGTIKEEMLVGIMKKWGIDKDFQPEI